MAACPEVVAPSFPATSMSERGKKEVMLEDKWSEVKHLYIPCDALGPSYMHVVSSARCPPTARGQECASAVWYQPAGTTASTIHVCT